MYKLTTGPIILSLLDGAFIPATLENNSYVDYLKWVKEGNTPEPADISLPLTYRELRAASYPLLGDQLDALWKGGEPKAAMFDLINAVKLKYPKP
tara:strand:- start:48 stop:332 length:285 start_codon:yes stop_codon:yes gene_type:complete